MFSMAILSKPVIGVGMTALIFGSAFWGSTQAVNAQENPGTELDVIKIRPNFYMIAGARGNIALQTGKDGTVLINTGSASEADRVVAAIKKGSPQESVNDSDLRAFRGWRYPVNLELAD
jgi:hypothetical protein